MLLMVEKGIGGGICHTIYQYVKAMKWWKMMIISYLGYWDISNFYGCVMSQKLPGKKGVEDTSQFNEDF